MEPFGWFLFLVVGLIALFVVVTRKPSGQQQTGTTSLYRSRSYYSSGTYSGNGADNSSAMSATVLDNS